MFAVLCAPVDPNQQAAQLLLLSGVWFLELQYVFLSSWNPRLATS